MTHFVKNTALAALALTMVFPVAGNALFKKSTKPAVTAPVDCTKTLNKLKAACKKPATSSMGAMAPMGAMAAKPAAAAPTAGGTIRVQTDKNGHKVNIDCSKAGNKTKKVCK